MESDGLDIRIMGTPCPDCGRTEYYCAKETDDMLLKIQRHNDELLAALKAVEDAYLDLTPNSGIAMSNAMDLVEQAIAKADDHD